MPWRLRWCCMSDVRKHGSYWDIRFHSCSMPSTFARSSSSWLPAGVRVAIHFNAIVETITLPNSTLTHWRSALPIASCGLHEVAAEHRTLILYYGRANEFVFLFIYFKHEQRRKDKIKMGFLLRHWMILSRANRKLIEMKRKRWQRIRRTK